jgi:phenylacetate-CoA ligase
MTLELTNRERATYGFLSAVLGANVTAAARRVRERFVWPNDRLEEFRVARLRDVLCHAAQTVPAYARRFAEAGFQPADFRDMGDLQRLPVLTRADLREQHADLRSTAVRDEEIIRRSTGGTTGTPVTVFLDKAGELERMLVNHRMYALMGRPLGSSTLLIAGSPIDAVRWTTFRDRVKNTVFGVTVHSSFSLTPSGLEQIVGEIASDKFEWVIAYASVFDILARYCSETERRLRIRNIVPCAELVTAAQRDRWLEAFGCEVFEIYGSREMTSIAGETPDHDGLLISADMFHVEITDESGRVLPDGEPGLITISTLAERAMPLLRYQLGDVGVLDQRSAGSHDSRRRLRITHGRVLDVICCPNGKLLPGEFFPHLMKEVEAAVERFQVVQSTPETLTVYIVRAGEWASPLEAYLRERIERQIGPGASIDFNYVSEIPHASSGKYRPTISLLPETAKRFRGG